MSKAMEDARYFAERAKQERDRAQRSSQVSVQLAHAELARLYDQRSAEPQAAPVLMLDR